VEDAQAAFVIVGEDLRGASALVAHFTVNLETSESGQRPESLCRKREVFVEDAHMAVLV